MMTQLNTMEDFQRDISYRLTKRDDGIAVLTATLKDRFHDIQADVLVEVDTLTITGATVDFRRAPSKDCCTVARRMEMLVGFSIGKGLTRKLLEVFGGGEGCGNMRNLLQGMLPLALNLRAAAGVTDEREMLDTIHNQLVGTCAGYVRPVDK
jgi:hypothetical protein